MLKNDQFMYLTFDYDAQTSFRRLNSLEESQMLLSNW